MTVNAAPAVPPWREAPDGLTLKVRLTPKAAHDRIDGVEILADGQAVLKTRVRAVPEKGAANMALVRLLAKELSLPKAAIRLLTGGQARLKTLHLEGDAASMIAQLENITRVRGI